VQVLKANPAVVAATVTVALLGVAAAVFHYVNEPYNPGFAQWPLIVAVHVIPGGIFLALAPVQFSARVRSRFPRYHRVAGRWLIAGGLFAGLAAMFISLVIPFTGNAERLLVTPFAAYFVYALAVGLGHARHRRITEHRAWMIRAFAISSSIATMRLIFIPALMVAGTEDIAVIRTLSLLSFLVAFAIHMVIAEWWLRRTANPARESAQPAVA
jgi:hypothetical protein